MSHTQVLQRLPKPGQRISTTNVIGTNTAIPLPPLPWERLLAWDRYLLLLRELGEQVMLICGTVPLPPSPTWEQLQAWDTCYCSENSASR